MSTHSTKTIDDLRERLFATIDAVRDGSLSVEQAKTISDLSQVIVNSAKVEVDFVRATERHESHFLASDAAPRLPAGANGIVGVRRHLLRDS